MDDCIFCKIIKGEIPSQKVYEDDDIIAFLDIRPINPGHTLVVPKTHAANILETSEEDAQKLVAAVKKIAPAILKAVGTESFNLSSNNGRASGQVVFHTHWHIMPRFPADGYEPWSRDDDKHDDLASMAEKIRANL
jgi:histidine triad (HIT) family protein